MHNRRHVLLAALALAAGRASAQRSIEGQVFDARLRVDGVDLLLNGTGVRGVAWFKGYVAALYLSENATTPERVLAAPGPKRLQMRMLVDVPAVEFVKAIDKGFARNTPAAAQASLDARRTLFGRQVLAVGTVTKGSVVDLDYLPGRGLQFSMGSQPRGELIPGEDLYAAVLRIFLGDKPVDARLKAGLLGGPLR